MDNKDSIIEVIQKMVQEGQSREKILQTLSDLGVTDEQSKRLLLIAEADTFTLLRREINKLVKDEVLSQKKDLEALVEKEMKEVEEEEKKKVAEVAAIGLKEAKEDIVGISKDFEMKVNKLISESQKGVSLVKMALDSLENRMAQMEIDVEQIKVHKFRRKSIIISYVLLGCGAVLLLLSFGLFFINFSSIDMTQIVVIVVLVVASIALMFASIIG